MQRLQNALPNNPVFWPARAASSKSVFTCSITQLPEMHQDIIMGMADEALAKILADLEADQRAEEERKKRKREEKLIERMNRTTKKRCTFGTGYNLEEFMKPISESVRNAWLAGFIDQTSNRYIQQAVCMVYAGRFKKCVMYLCNVMDIPHQEKIVPQDPHPTAILTNNMLLHRRAIFHDGNSEQGYICQTCWYALVDE
ncbi:hypothetical protein M422DRAFT_241006 [Sphaerobolus stellatus SS14]|nr:hypothetical protein M422DRAFT_241006 [Sphaerobolus stellatus SS14]